MSGVVAFAGSRSVVPPAVVPAVGSVLASGRSVVVGCAGGVDAAVVAAVVAAGASSRLSVLAAFPASAARVLASVVAAGGSPASVSLASDSAGLAPGLALAWRTRSVVAAAARGGPGSALVAFPSGPCPAACRPGPSPVGGGSGTWLAVALAVGAAFPAVVFLPPGVPAPPWAGGRWAPAAGSGVWSAAVRWVPVQPVVVPGAVTALRKEALIA